MKNLHLKIVAFTLVGIAGLLMWHKVANLGLPLTPEEETGIWTVEARLALQTDGGPTQVAFMIPRDPSGLNVLGEDFVSGRFGLARESDAVNRRALWTARRVDGQQTLYYRLQVADAPDEAPEAIAGAQPAFPPVPDYAEPYGSAAFTVLEEVRQESADIASFARRLLLRYYSDNPDEHVQVLRSGIDGERAHIENVIHILAGARIPARTAHVLHLQDGMRRGELEPYLEVHDGSSWIPFDPQTGQRGYDEEMLVWYRGEAPLVEVSGGRVADIGFSASRTFRAVVQVAQQRAEHMGSRVLDFSLFALPVDIQNVYHTLMLVPLGALVVVLVRNVVGISTFGTFMPVLIALAFRETQLLWGIALFSTVVALGLAFRFYLERLKLLLVPRLAAVLVVVVLLIMALSILSHHLGLERGLSVALFPMVILAMTIERMSVVWEENGPRTAITQGLGSLLVAVLGYLLMNYEPLAHLVFVFPESLLLVLAVILLMGRYSGYRLTELWRFRMFFRDRKDQA
ncbi:inactive transglutaminase family protein [Aquisalimonas lutea]|uniref:inactive transglutaminase family protein n=1 Tax=Aquisalimonas lutea TaxID=1327750 RepID=UPI0025B5E456|nr:inactive transglutaminase family protein [Aquisalimonas lutea]MDN3517480.1 inactive transglutaminase family protein [Aquisalimonas lutea]